MDKLQVIGKINTPAYVFYEKELKDQIEMIKEKTPNYGLCFAMKANPFMVGVASKYVGHIEVCSPGEYEICIRENIDPKKIIVSGVNKTVESMQRIVGASGGKGIYTIESYSHFEILKMVAEEKGVKLDVIIRLSSGNQFGVSLEEFKTILGLIINEENMNFVGIHYYSGTQKKLKKISKELSMLDELAKEIKREFNISNMLLEYGPGLVVDYFVSDKENLDKPAFEENSLQVDELVALAKEMKNFDSITFEMGRFIASYCGAYYTKVVDVKNNGNSNFLIVDGGIHQINYYGQMLGMKHPYIEHVSCDNEKTIAKSDSDSEKYTICGSLCTVNDILVRDYALSNVKEGDCLVFDRCGAYSVTEGMAMFLSRELPEVSICDIDGNIILKRSITQTNIFNSNSID